MAKHRKNIPGLTRQGVKDLSYIKAPPSKRMELPPSFGMQCDHPPSSIREDQTSGCTHCVSCKSFWDFDGRPI